MATVYTSPAVRSREWSLAQLLVWAFWSGFRHVPSGTTASTAASLSNLHLASIATLFRYGSHPQIRIVDPSMVPPEGNEDGVLDARDLEVELFLKDMEDWPDTIAQSDERFGCTIGAVNAGCGQLPSSHVNGRFSQEPENSTAAIHALNDSMITESPSRSNCLQEVGLTSKHGITAQLAATSDHYSADARA
ncbi:hypothetical protein BC939DRAFT_477781 [Gamsiella multidivaricata]|uniref:uncharacterized protein n=1 Tax=Gamsiella multidivaricata TaxID=101098 RepID=UPI00221EBC94|nr:uncharacterized protein BC939DRAFT_477781 [Gamsiella multidivaricata]KAI7822613.1 hypothetical protein BC939DRAFT_477781 [Gamsiella multidivaricata]